MECYYHPERESTDTCAICGKSICKECGLEIAGKVYCKECLEKIVGLGIESKAPEQPEPVVAAEPVRTQPARLNKQPVVEENIYQPPKEEIYQPPQEPVTPEIKQISDDSPYNIKENIEYSGGLESSYISDNEAAAQVQPAAQPQISQNEYELRPEKQIAQQPTGEQDFIYPDHSYEPEPTSARVELEDKYEKYLDDLYFDDANDVPLNEQLAKDEEQFGSLTRRPYQPRKEESLLKDKKPSKPETPEEMEARIRAEILAEAQGKGKGGDGNIHNLNYTDEKEPMSVVDIILTIILIIVILVVIYYIIYVFFLATYYPTFMDAIYGLSNPQNVINNILTPQPQQ
ncbi:ATPase [Methanobrevibacter sp.]